MGASKQLKQKRHSHSSETTTNLQEDGHHEPDNKDEHDYQEDDHDKDYETIRAEHKRIAVEFQQESKERLKRYYRMTSLTYYRACHASDKGDEFCDRFQDTITPHDELFSPRVHKFYKMQDYFQQKRDGYFARFRKLEKSKNVATLKAYRKRLESYLANVDSYSAQEDTSEFSALLDAHEVVVPLRLKWDAGMAELIIHTQKFIQTVDLLIGWQLERRHYMAKPTDDMNNANVSHPTPVIMNYYHYR
jgi:hypothetical protein